MDKIIKFENWEPEIYRVPIENYSQVVEDAILYEKFGIYISYGSGLHAYHGNDAIDRDLCEKLNIRVVDLYYNGGTIIGSEKDLSIIVVFPTGMDLTHELIINKIVDIIKQYIPETTVNGNDILIEDKKVSGSMMRQVLHSTVWAAQITFEDYTNYINQVCQKAQIKIPSYIDSTKLTKNQLEEEILSWFKNKN